MWYCPPCLQSIFVYNHYDEDQDFFAAVLEGILDHTFRLHEINSKVFSPFEINQDLDTPLSEIDPDLQYYSESNYIQNMNCEYYFEDSFQNNISNNTNYCNKMSFFPHKYQKPTKALWWFRSVFEFSWLYIFFCWAYRNMVRRI